MSNKKSKETEQKESKSPLGELEQLREIVFGDAQQQLVSQITTLRSDMEQALSLQSQTFSVRLDKMQTDITQQFDELNKNLQFVDKTHDENEATMQKSMRALFQSMKCLQQLLSKTLKISNKRLIMKALQYLLILMNNLNNLKTTLKLSQKS